MAIYTVSIMRCIFAIFLADINLTRKVHMVELDSTDQLTFESKYDDVMCTCKKIHQTNTRIAATSVNMDSYQTTSPTFDSSESLLSHDMNSYDGGKTAKSIFSTPSMQISSEMPTNTVHLASSLVILDQSMDSSYNFQSTSGSTFLSTLDMRHLQHSIKTTSSLDEMLTTTKTTVRRDAEFPSIATSGARVAVDLKSENLTVITVTVPAQYQQMSQEATVSVNVPSPTGSSHITLSITSVPSGTSGTITFSTTSGDSVVSFMIPSEASGTAFAIEVPSKFSRRPTNKDSTRKAIIKIVHEVGTGGTDNPGNAGVTHPPKQENTVEAEGATRVESSTSIYQHPTSTISTTTGVLNRTERAPTTFPATESTWTRDNGYIETTKTSDILEHTTEETMTSSWSSSVTKPTTETITKKPTMQPEWPVSPNGTTRVTEASSVLTSLRPNLTWLDSTISTTESKITNEATWEVTTTSKFPTSTDKTTATTDSDKIPMSSYWIKTVIETSPSILGNETYQKTIIDGLRASYRKAYQNLIRSADFTKNQTSRHDRSSEIDIQIVNSTYLNNTIPNMEFVYFVTLNGTAIEAQNATAALGTITDQEMAIILGHVITLKAEPYSSVTAPQPLQSDSGSALLPAILGAIFGLLLLVVIIIVLLRLNSTRKRRKEQMLIIKEQQRQQELQESYSRRDRQIAFIMDDDTYGHEVGKEKMHAKSGRKKMAAKRSRELPSSALLTSELEVAKPQPKPRKKKPRNGESQEKLLKSNESLSDTTNVLQGITNMAANNNDHQHGDVSAVTVSKSDSKQLLKISRRPSQFSLTPILKEQNSEFNAIPAQVDQCDALPSPENHGRSYTLAKDSIKETTELYDPSPKLESKERPHVHFGATASGPMNARQMLNGPDEVDTASNLMAWNDPETRFLISSIKDELKKFKDSLPSPGPPFMDV